MPLYLDGQDPRTGAAAPMRAPIGAGEGDPFVPAPTLADTAAAAFRQNNPIVSTIEAIANQSPDHTFDPAHNPLETAKGTPLEQDPGAILDSPNEATTRAIIARRQQEDLDRSTMARSGTAGTVAGLAAGLLDPSFYIPIAGEVRAAGAAASLGRSALRTAAGGALQSTASEAALMATQQRRTWTEAAGNIGSNTLLMGVLGGVLGLLSPAERAEANAGLEAMRREATPINPADPSSPSLADHVEAGASGFSGAVEQRAAEMQAAGVAADPLDAAHAAIIDRIPEDIAHEVDGGAAQEGIRAAEERGGAGAEYDPGSDPAEPSAGQRSDGVGSGDAAAAGPAAGGAGADGDAGRPLSREVDVGTVLGDRSYVPADAEGPGYYRRKIVPGPEPAEGTPAGRMTSAVHSIAGRRPDFIGGEAEVWRTSEGIVRIANEPTDMGYRTSNHVLQPIAVDRRNGMELLPEVLDVGELKDFPRDSVRRMIEGLAADGLMVVDHDHRNFGYHDGRLVTFDPGAVAPMRGYGATAHIEKIARDLGDVDLAPLIERAKRQGLGPERRPDHPREAARFLADHPLHVERKAITDRIAADLEREGFRGDGFDAQDVLDTILDHHLRGRKIAGEANAMLEEGDDGLTRAALNRSIAALDHLGDVPAAVLDNPLTGAEVRPLRTTTLRDALAELPAPAGGDALDAAARQTLAPILARLAGDTPVHVLLHDDLQALTEFRLHGDVAGYYDPDARHIAISDDAGVLRDPVLGPRYLMHEAVHAAFSNVLEKTPALQGLVERIRAAAEAAHVAAGGARAELYGLTNADEFLAEGLSQPAFQRFLASVPADAKLAAEAGIGRRGATLWDGLVALARKALGLGADKQTLLDVLMQASRRLEDARDPAGRGFDALAADTRDSLARDPRWRGGWDEDRTWSHMRDLFPTLDDDTLQKVADRVQAGDGGQPAPRGASMADQLLAAMRAFHGTPHDVDRFSSSKIGTGEGAQAYGHGLYFAENDRIAEGYQHRLSGFDRGIAIDGKPFDHAAGTPAERNVADLMLQQDFSKDGGHTRVNRAIQQGLIDARKSGDADLVRLAQEREAVWDRWEGTAEDVTKPRGNLYTVSIDRDAEHFLHHDRDFADQPAYVLDRLKALGIDHSDFKPEYAEPPARGGFMARMVRRQINESPTGAVILRDLEREARAAGSATPEADAARKLSEAGIAGVRYLDAGSRIDGGDGTHNLVVFNDQDVSITHRNGEAVTPAERSRLLASLREAPPPAGDGGAAAADARDLQLKSFGLDRVPGLRTVNSALSPNLRIYTNSLSVAAKRAMADLAETALRFTMHDRGVATSADGPLETIVRRDHARFTAATHDILQDAWSDHRYGDAAPGLAQRAADSLADARGRTPAGKLSYKDFKGEVFDALAAGDQHPIPQVQQAAQEMRAKVLDPLARMAQETMGPDGRPMLGEELAPPRGDQSFVPRMWNKEAVTPKRFQLKQIITDWLAGEQATKAAAKDRLTDLSSRHAALVDQIGKLDGRLETIRGRQEETGTRLDERGQEVRRAEGRADVLGDRAGIVRDAQSELDEFVSAMRDQARDPEQRARLVDLEREAVQLRREAAPMSAAEMQRLEQAEVADVLPGDLRRAAETYLGKRRLPDAPSFVSSLIKQGGINDVGGDVRHMLGGTRARPGLLNAGGRTLDRIGEDLFSSFPHAFPERPSVDDVSELIENSLRGKEPSWWREHAEPADSPAGRTRQFAGALEDFFRETGQEPRTLREVAEALKADRGDTPAVLDRLQQKIEAGRDLAGAREDIAGRRAALGELRDLIELGRQDRATLRQRGQVADARAGEAGSAAHANRGRLGLLQDRLGRQQTMEDMLQAARDNAEADRTALRGKMEDELRAWQGDAAGEAQGALRSRDEAERVRGLKQQAGIYGGAGARLTSADAAVDGAVRRILKSDRDLPREELASRADEIIDRIVGSPDGRIPYDAASGGPQIGFTGGAKQEARGSLRSRDFAIPTALVRDFVNRDLEHVVGSHLRTLLPDVQLTRRFGDVDMTDVFRRIQEDYSRRIGPETSEAEARAAQAQRDADIRDVAAVRDRLRNVYGWNPDPSARKVGAIVRDFRNASSLASLGTSVANRLNDVGAQAVMRYGLANVFNDAWRPFFKSMLGMSPLAGAAKRQAAEMGVGIDGLLGHLRHNLSDINESYLPGSKFSRALSWANDRSMLVNLHGPWTDWMKAMAWVPAQAELGRVADRIAAGQGTAKDLATMADANISPGMAARISAQLGQHSIVVDDVRLADAGKWTDLPARDAFERAMAREANINVITAGIGDKPLFLSKPLGGLIGQFKGFVAGAHERILISNLQQRDGRTMQGALVATAMGMLSYRLYTLLSGQQASERPQDWVKEGLSRSALPGWFNEGNNLLAKFTAGKVDYNRLYGADRPLSRRAENSPLSELLGPTYARLEGLTGIATHAMAGKFSAADIHQARMALPLQNLMGFRVGLDEAEDGVANALGLKPRSHTPREWAPGGQGYPVQ